MSAALTDRIVAFLREIGLEVEERTLPQDTVLPGISVEAGTLLFDRDKLSFPGDLLHEAGHLAVVPAAERASLGADTGGEGGPEMGAIAWSFAACVFLQLPVETVFHPAGYKGGAANIAENFTAGRYFGVPILEWRGLTDYQQPGTADSPTRFPKMKRWLAA